MGIEEMIADRLCDPKRFLPEVRSIRKEIDAIAFAKPGAVSNRARDDALNLGLCLEGLEREILGWV